MKKILLAASLGLSSLSGFAGGFSGDFVALGIQSGYTSGKTAGKSVNEVPVNVVGLSLEDQFFFAMKIGLDLQSLTPLLALSGTYASSLDSSRRDYSGNSEDAILLHLGYDVTANTILGIGSFQLGVGSGKNDKEINYITPSVVVLRRESDDNAKVGLGVKVGSHVRILQNIQLRAFGEYSYLLDGSGHLIRYGGMALVNTSLLSESLALTAEATGTNVIINEGSNTAVYTLTGGVLFTFDL